MIERQIYLDHGASTPVHPQVLAAMMPYWTETYGNPSSVHRFGRKANRALAQARRTFADLLHVAPDELVFTGCGSESDNMALRGVMMAARQAGRGNHLIVSAIEHEAVLQTAVQLRDQYGFDLTVLPVDPFGRVQLSALAAAIRADTVLISVMAANNEIGTWQPLMEIGALAHEHGLLFHTDAIQAAAYRHWNLQEQPIDLMSLAPHKFYGPKGVGILAVRRHVPLLASLTGGGQEEGRRAGTVNVAFAVGAAAAFALAMSEMRERTAHLQKLRDRLIAGLLTAVPHGMQLTGHPTDRLPHHVSFAFQHLNANDLLMHLDMAGIAASSGSACKTGDPKPSKILQAMGLDDSWTKGGLRMTVGNQNRLEEIEFVIEELPKMVQKLTKLQAGETAV